jgi:hypothetical protein
MKKTIAFSSVTVLIISSIVLNIYLLSRLSSENNNNEYGQLWGTTDCIPDEATAKKVADIVIEAHAMFGDFELGYDVTVESDDKRNEWVVMYRPIPEEGYTYEGGDIEFRIRKDNGTVTTLGKYL